MVTQEKTRHFTCNLTCNFTILWIFWHFMFFDGGWLAEWITHSILCAVIVGCCIVLCCNLSSTCCCCICQHAVAAFVNVLLLLSSACCCCSSTCCCYVAPFVVVSLLCPFDIPIAFVLFCKCEGGCPEWGKGAFYLRASAEICTLWASFQPNPINLGRCYF